MYQEPDDENGGENNSYQSDMPNYDGCANIPWPEPEPPQNPQSTQYESIPVKKNGRRRWRWPWQLLIENSLNSDKYLE